MFEVVTDGGEQSAQAFDVVLVVREAQQTRNTLVHDVLGQHLEAE